MKRRQFIWWLPWKQKMWNPAAATDIGIPFSFATASAATQFPTLCLPSVFNETGSRMSERDEIAVLELGISEDGQMDVLSEIVRPDMAVVTTIGCCYRFQCWFNKTVCINFFPDNRNKQITFSSDYFYAVANAHPEIQNMAHSVIPSNDEDGVARFIEQMMKQTGEME